jgi:hypothetical protein
MRPDKPLEGHYIITEVDPNIGDNAKFVNHCGVFVRDKVPISVRE